MVIGMQRAAELLRDLVADREAESEALARRLGAEERLEHARQVLGRDAGSGIAYGDDRARALAPHRHFYASLAAHRLRRIEQQIEEHLLELAGSSRHLCAA